MEQAASQTKDLKLQQFAIEWLKEAEEIETLVQHLDSAEDGE